eukprot:5378277-Pyramimonas_sp.AAC.2
MTTTIQVHTAAVREGSIMLISESLSERAICCGSPYDEHVKLHDWVLQSATGGGEIPYLKRAYHHKAEGKSYWASHELRPRWQHVLKQMRVHLVTKSCQSKSYH